MPTPIKLNCPDQPPRQRPSRWGFLAALAFLLLPAGQLHAVQQIFWPNYQWPPPGWYFGYTNSAPVLYFTNSATLVLSARQFVMQPMTDTSITPPATNLYNVYSNFSCLLTFQASTNNGTNWFQSQGTGYVYVAVIYTNSPMTLQMTNSYFLGTNTLGSFKIHSSPTKSSLGQTLLAPTSGGYLISGSLNIAWEYSFNNGLNYKAATTNAYVELAGTPGAPSSLALQVSKPTATTIQVCWPTVASYSYQVQVLPKLGGTNWSNLGSALPGTGSTVCQSYSALGGSNQFYRVVATNSP